MTYLTASIGAEISGVQLNQLNDKAKDQLALLAAQKKVLGMHDLLEYTPSLLFIFN